jgi:tRNA pseudouridine55 synthase
MCRRRFGTRRVGHAGTLDPAATGLLLIGVGRATKLLTYLVGADKTYQARIRFGTTTSTLDAEGDVTGTYDMAGRLPIEAVRRAAATLCGDQLQVPPMVSAIKVDGVRLHELARRGVEVERAPRPIHVSRFDVFPTDEPLEFESVIDCSSGTYIRVLAADLGERLGGGAHLASLRRTQVGPFSEADARAVEASELLDPIEALRGFPRVVVTTHQAAELWRGGLISADDLGLPPEVDVAAAVSAIGRLVALLERHRGAKFKPAVPFPA